MSTRLKTNGTTTPEALLDQIASAEVKLPKLAPSVLCALALEHFDKQRKGEGAPRAEAVAKSFLSTNGTCSSQEQAANEKRQKEWIAGRIVEYLRHRIADDNPALVELAASTLDRDVREACVHKIYTAIGAAFPSLAKSASEARIRKIRELAAIRQEPLPPEPPTAAPTGVMAKEMLPDAWKDDAIIQGQANQVANLMLVCLRTVHQYLKPAAGASGIALDEQSLHAWSVTCFIEMCKSSKAHFKLSPEREQIGGVQ